MQLLKDFFSPLWGVITSMRFPVDFIDIIFVAVLLYYCIRFIRDARAGQLLKGIAVIFIVMQLANILELSALSYIVSSFLQYGFLAIVVLFQPELRTVLEKMGRTNLRNINIFNMRHGDDSDEKQRLVRETVDCCKNLSTRKIGGLLVFEGQTKLGDIVDTGVTVDAELSAQMLGTIFFPNTPLHDGAVIVRENRIAAAGCLLPLTQRAELSSSLGTRHRAAVGISEVSDAVTVVVSEETGNISYTQNGQITIGITPDELTKVLTEYLMNQTSANLKKGGKNNA